MLGKACREQSLPTWGRGLFEVLPDTSDKDVVYGARV
jgi:hypothetical protein